MQVGCAKAEDPLMKNVDADTPPTPTLQGNKHMESSLCQASIILYAGSIKQRVGRHNFCIPDGLKTAGDYGSWSPWCYLMPVSLCVSGHLACKSWILRLGSSIMLVLVVPTKSEDENSSWIFG